MRYSLDCVVCLQRQCLEAARFSSDDPDVHLKVLESTMRTLLDAGLDTTAPYIGTIVHRNVRLLTGNNDPYYAEKKRFNKLALDRWDDFQRWIANSSDPFETTIRLAIAGNSIDFALESITVERINEMINRATTQRMIGSVQELREAIEKANTILYLTDNAGEIVYDRLLVERLVSPEFGKDVTVVTRGKPIINDALLEDAEEVGMTKVAPVMTNGGDGLGVIYDELSEEFKERFVAADLVIAKGLANLESLWTVDPRLTPQKIAFLFKAKCPFIAEEMGAQLGDLVVKVR